MVLIWIGSTQVKPLILFHREVDSVKLPSNILEYVFLFTKFIYFFFVAKRGGIAEDNDNFILLIRDLKRAFQPHGYLLTAAIGAVVPTIDTSYDVASMYKYLDLVHVMCYDYHVHWDKKTGHNAPLHTRPQDTGKDAYLNVEHTVNHLMKKVG